MIETQLRLQGELLIMAKNVKILQQVILLFAAVPTLHLDLDHLAKSIGSLVLLELVNQQPAN